MVLRKTKVCTSKYNYITSHTQPNMNTCPAYTQTHTHKHTHTHAHTRTIPLIRINCIIIHVFTSQVMDSKADSETLNNLLENDMIPLSGEESDIDLLGPDPDINSQEDMRITKPFSILDELLASPPIRNSTNTTTPTTSSTITHPLSCMIATTTYSTISTTIYLFFFLIDLLKKL